MKKSRLLLSVVSILLVFCLMAGGTMAWFTDTEKVQGNFSAGVLDITLTPGELTTAPLLFQNLRPMEYEAFKAEINPAGNGNLHTEGYGPAPQYFQPVVIKNAGTLPVYLEVSTKALDMTKHTCPSGGEEKITLGEEGNPGKVDWNKTGKNGACTNKLADVLKIVLFEKINGAWTVVADNLNPGSAGKPYAPGVIIPAATGEKTYVVGAYLPNETTGNEYQGKHFHGSMVVRAFQTDAGAGAPNIVKIESAEELAAFAAAVNAGTAEHKVYRLTENIVIQDEWTPIGTEANPFTAVFDGNGHTITGLKIKTPGSYKGLFGCVYGGTIRNLTLKEADLSFGGQKNNWIGGLAGSLENGGKIENCAVEGNVKANGYDNMLVGGIVGTIENGTVSGCTFSGNVRGSQAIGGIAGRLMKGTVEKCLAYGGEINGDTSGGIVGSVAKDGVVKACCAANKIYNAAGYASGGIVGTATGGAVQECTALNSSVRTAAGYYNQLGRIAGKVNKATLSNNYAWEGVAVQFDFTVPATLTDRTPNGTNGGDLAVQGGKLMNGAELYTGVQPEVLPEYLLGA